MKTTIKEVAQRASVSPSTVSRVIHNNSRISEATRKRVFQAMEELNYHPNAMARSLASRSTHTIGLILPNSRDDLFLNPFFISAMRGISVYAQPEGYKIMYTFSRNEEEEVQFLQDYINSRWVDGIILFTARQKDRCIETLQERRFPFVVIGRPQEPQDAPWVDNDNIQAMYNVVKHLTHQGCREIAFIGGPLEMNVTRNRLAGYRHALKEQNLPCRESMILTGSDFLENTGYSCFHQLWEGNQRPDAIVTTDDLLSLGILKAMKEMGIDDIRVTGFNNSLQGASRSPALTSVDINPDRLGSRAAELLIQNLRKEEIAQHSYIVETELIVRDSSRSREPAI